jgi:inward rectifier potassium channel
MNASRDGRDADDPAGEIGSAGGGPMDAAVDAAVDTAADDTGNDAGDDWDDLRLTEQDRDLGFGSVVSAQSRRRLLNRDGSFNVERRGLRWRDSLSPYQGLLTMSWSSFLALATLGYLTVCLLFAVLYYLCGPQALSDPADWQLGHFARAFFMSVQTLSTVGFGNIVPLSAGANLLMTVESIFGLFGVALVTGLVFARFSRPTARILFSKNAVVAPYQGGRAFMFRIANQRKNQIVNLRAQVLFSRLETKATTVVRRFYSLDLERSRVTFFPLAWTIVHPIGDDSPLAGVTEADCEAADAEFLILLTGTDETFSQTVHAWSSYKAHEVSWGAVFEPLYDWPSGDGPIAIDVSHLHDLRPAQN